MDNITAKEAREICDRINEEKRIAKEKYTLDKIPLLFKRIREEAKRGYNFLELKEDFLQCNWRIIEEKIKEKGFEFYQGFIKW